MAVSRARSCGLSCSVWWRVRAHVDPAEPGREPSVISAVGAQRVGPDGEDLADEGAVLLRPGRSARPGRDRAAITALTRLVGVEPAADGPDRARVVGVPGLEFVESRPLGGAWLLDRLWHRLGIDILLRRLAAGT